MPFPLFCFCGVVLPQITARIELKCDSPVRIGVCARRFGVDALSTVSYDRV
jgi:hypothetical protein